jgi:peptide chain release factor subunit 1
MEIKSTLKSYCRQGLDLAFPGWKSRLFHQEEAMLTDRDLQELVSYRPKHDVLSVYLNVDPSEGGADAYKLRLRQLLKKFEEHLPQDVEILNRFVEHEYDWSGRSLVLFSCAPEKFFRSYSLGIPVRDRARALNRAYVKPLADLLDNYGNYGIVLVDRQGARIFHFHLGELREHEGTFGEEVRHIKQGGGSQAAGRRGGSHASTSQTQAIERNLRDAANLASDFFKENLVRRILISGTDANVARFQDQLAKSWRSLVVGTFPMSITSGHPQILKRSMEIARETERQREAKLVSAMITAAAKGQEGVIRLDDTLGAVHAGRVQTLVVHEGFRAAGYRCQVCDYITTQKLDQCPFCDGSFEKIVDAVEHAVRRVLENNGEVDVVHENPKLKRAGSIGALLRY